MTLPLWVIPLVLTVVYFMVASRYQMKPSFYFNIDLEGLFRYIVALILTLITWLIYFIIV